MGDPRRVDPAAAALGRVRAFARTVGRHGPPEPQLAGARADTRDPRLLGASISDWIKENRYDSQLAVAGLQGLWATIAEGPVGRYVHLDTFEATTGRLTLLADSQEWADQLRYLITRLQHRIDAEIGAGVVREIVIRTPGMRRYGALRVRHGRRSPRLPPVEPPGPQDTAPETLFDSGAGGAAFADGGDPDTAKEALSTPERSRRGGDLSPRSETVNRLS